MKRLPTSVALAWAVVSTGCLGQVVERDEPTEEGQETSSGGSDATSTAEFGSGVLGDGTRNDCQGDSKACTGECVALDKAEFGCASPSCAPCALASASSMCVESGECVVAACRGSLGDCDDESANGCETNLDNDIEHCGRCGQECADPLHGEAACGGGHCYVRQCYQDYEDCDGLWRNGCEVDLSSDPAHCGDCSKACADHQSCVDGVCE